MSALFLHVFVKICHFFFTCLFDFSLSFSDLSTLTDRFINEWKTLSKMICKNMHTFCHSIILPTKLKEHWRIRFKQKPLVCLPPCLFVCHCWLLCSTLLRLSPQMTNLITAASIVLLSWRAAYKMASSVIDERTQSLNQDLSRTTKSQTVPFWKRWRLLSAQQSKKMYIRRTWKEKSRAHKNSPTK